MAETKKWLYSHGSWTTSKACVLLQLYNQLSFFPKQLWWSKSPGWPVQPRQQKPTTGIFVQCPIHCTKNLIISFDLTIDGISFFSKIAQVVVLSYDLKSHWETRENTLVSSFQEKSCQSKAACKPCPFTSTGPHLLFCIVLHVLAAHLQRKRFHPNRVKGPQLLAETEPLFCQVFCGKAVLFACQTDLASPNW